MISYTPFPDDLATDAVRGLIQAHWRYRLPADVSRWRPWGRLTPGGLVNVLLVPPALMSGEFRPVGVIRRPTTLVAWFDRPVPLKHTAPLYAVADWLHDHGREDTEVWRLLMWFHWQSQA